MGSNYSVVNLRREREGERSKKELQSYIILSYYIYIMIIFTLILGLFNFL